MKRKKVTRVFRVVVHSRKDGREVSRVVAENDVEARNIAVARWCNSMNLAVKRYRDPDAAAGEEIHEYPEYTDDDILYCDVEFVVEAS